MSEETRTVELTVDELQFVLDGLQLLYSRLLRNAAHSQPRHPKQMDQLKHCQVVLQRLAMLKHHPEVFPAADVTLGPATVNG